MSASKYSGVVQLNDLDDFIGPGLVLTLFNQIKLNS